MKPLRMKVQAFGPFAEGADVDFQTLAQHSIYGLYGPTGSGKTSLLDALCYALFGKSSGNEREHYHLRSHFTDPVRETHVYLLFSLGEKQYLIFRRPEQFIQKPLKNGQTKLVKRSMEVQLFDVSGLDLEQIWAELDGTSAPLLAKNQSQASHTIHELLGYSFDQFQQIVVLPQGQFRKFLNADNKQRSDILRTLFPVQLYERWEEWLANAYRGSETELNQLNAAQKEILVSQNVENIDEMIDRQEQQKTIFLQQKEKVSQSQLIFEKQVQKLNEARQKATWFHEFKGLKHRQEELATRRKEFADWQMQLINLEKAKSVTPFYQAFCAAEKDKDAVAIRLKGQKQRQLDCQKTYENAKQERENNKALGDEIATLQKRLQKLAELIPLFDRLSQLKSDLAGATTLVEQKEQVKNELTQQIADLKEKLEKTKTRWKNFQDSEIAEVHAQKQLLDIENKLTLLKKIRDFNEKNDQISLKIMEAEKRLESEQNSEIRAARKNSQLKQNYLQHSATRIAANLKPDDACPVCGSHEHPKLAHIGGDEEFAQLEKAMDDGERHLQEAQKIVMQSKSDLQALSHRQSELAEAKEELIQTLGHPVSSNNLPDILPNILTETRADHAKAQQLIARLKIDLENKADTGLQLMELERSLKLKETKLLTLQSEWEASRSTQMTLAAEWKAQLEVGGQSFENGHNLKAEHAEKEKILKSRQTLFTQLQDDLNEAKIQNAQASTLMAEISEQARLQELAFNEASVNFQDQLVQVSFADRQVYEQYLALDEPDLRAKIKRFEDERLTVATRMQDLADKIGDQKEPDLAAIQVEHDKFKQAMDETKEVLFRLDEKNRQLDQTVTRLRQLEQQYDKIDKNMRSLGKLAEVAGGKGANTQKIRLTDWILADYFEEVLLQANIHFEQMTGGRMQLRRTEDPDIKRGRRSRGLDISVFDIQTSRERPAVTLSGGEGFLASLALALGLSDVIQQESGGVRLEAIFIDEGFGQLDEEALSKALDILTSLSKNGRSIGLISHLEEVKRRVPGGLLVTPSPHGSAVSYL